MQRSVRERRLCVAMLIGVDIGSLESMVESIMHRLGVNNNPLVEIPLCNFYDTANTYRAPWQPGGHD